MATIVCIIGYLALGGLLLFDEQYPSAKDMLRRYISDS